MSKPAREFARIEVSLPTPYVLIIDDDQGFLEEAREFFSALGYGVDTARTPEEAKQIIEQNGHDKYLLVATDIDFADLSKTRGDDFVLENQNLLGKAKKVVISGGQWLTEERRKQLKEANIPFLGKPPTLYKMLADFTKVEGQRRASALQSVVKKETERITGVSAHITIAARSSTATAAATALAPAPAPGKMPKAKPYRPLNDVVFERFKKTLINWLKTRREPDKPVLAYGQKVYSANDLIREVRDETEVGLEHVEMLLEEFEHSLGVKDDASQFNDEDEE